MHTNISHHDLNGAIIGDNIWTSKTFDTNNKGCPKFQMHESDTYLVELRPRDGWRGLIFGPLVSEDRHLRIINGAETGPGWVKLYNRLQKIGYDVKVSLIQTKRLDFLKMKHTLRNGASSTCSCYFVYLESEVVSPEKFYKFISQADNGEKIQEAIKHQLRIHIHNHVMSGAKSNEIIQGGRIVDPLLEEAGYEVRRFSLFYYAEKDIS